MGVCILKSFTFFVFIILIVLLLIKTKILRLETYYNSVYYKKKCDNTKFFNLPDFKTLENKDLGKYFMELSYNVEASNCINLGGLPPIPKGFENRIQIKGTSYDGIIRPFAYIFTNPNNILIIFTGTVFTDEWFEDLDLSQTAPTSLKGYIKGVLCHSGFYNIYSTLQKQIRDEILNSGTGVSVYISGHSLGGALATLCSYDLAYLKPQLYTFGSPRVFNTKGAQILNEEIPIIQRVYNTEDIFTTVPLPQAFDENYEHVANGGVPFTMNLGSIPENHTDAYLKFYS